jgi:hypothetical protein
VVSIRHLLATSYLGGMTARADGGDIRIDAHKGGRAPDLHPTVSFSNGSVTVG